MDVDEVEGTRPAGPRPGGAGGPVRVLGATRVGVRAELVTVEAHFEPNERTGTQILLTGLPDPVLRESRGRLLTGLRLCARPESSFFVRLFLL